MAKSPFYKILLSDDSMDISQYISALRFEDCVEEDNLLVLNIDKADLNLVDEIGSLKGKLIKFQYGYLGGKKSGYRQALIKSIEVKYVNSIKIVIKAHDRGFSIKKQASNRVYENLTSSEIVKIIAGEFGFEAQIQDTTEKHTIPQGNKTYWEFLKRLAIKEGVDFFVKDNIMIFKQRDLSVEAKKLYEYNNGNGNVKSFIPKYEDKGSSNKMSANGIDTDTGDIFNVSSTPEQTNEAGLGKKLLKFDINGNRLNDPSESGEITTPPEVNINQIQSQTDKQVKDSNLESTAGTLQLEFDPTVETEDIITLAGVAKEHSGNWYTFKKTDIISSGAASTSLEVKRNATNNEDGGDGDPSSVNNTIGDKDAEQTKEIKVRKYDINGNQTN